MDLHEVIVKLSGPIDPIGCSGTDAERLENLKVLTSTIACLLQDLYDLSHRNGKSYENSRKIAAEHIQSFFENNADFFVPEPNAREPRPGDISSHPKGEEQ